MTIYEDVKRYAEKTMMTEEQAKIRCDYYLNLKKEIDEKMAIAIICPACKQPTLSFEPGSYEEGYGDYVECNGEGDCEYSSEEHSYPHHSDDFDVVLMFACQIEREALAETEKSIGLPWSEFIAKEVDELGKDPFEILEEKLGTKVNLT